MVALNQLVSELVVKDSASAVFDRVGQAAEQAAKKVDGAGNSAETTSQKINLSSRSLEAQARAFEQAKRATDPAYDAQTRYANAVQQAQRWVQSGIATEDEAASVLSRKRKALDDVTVSYDEAAAAAAKYKQQASDAAADVTARNSQQAVNQQLGVKEPSTGAAAASAGVFQAEQAAADAAAREAAANETLLQKYSPLAAAQAAYLKQLNEINTLEKAGVGTSSDLAAARDKVKTAFAGQVQEINGVAAAQRAAQAQEQALAAASQAVTDKLNPQAAIARKVGEETARLGTLVQAGGITEAQAAAAAAQYAKELANLATAHDHATGSASKMREGMVLVHEFLSGNWKRAVGSATIEMQNFGVMGYLLNPITLGFIAIGAAVLATFAIMQRFAESQKELANAVRLGGDATGYTKDQLAELAETTGHTTSVSTSAARSIETAFASTGRIGGQTLAQLTHLTGNFASATGKNATEAAGELAKIFSDPVKGAKQLDDSYNLLDASQQRDIKNLSEQGRMEEARQKLIDALGPRIDKASDKVTGLGNVAREVGKIFDGLLESIGRIGTAPGLDEQIAKIQKALDQAKNPVSPIGVDLENTGLTAGVNTPDLQAQLAALQAQKKANEDKAAADQHAADMRIEGNSADELVHKYDPLLDKKQTLTNNQILLNQAIKDGVGNLTEEQAALAGVTSALDHLRSPLEEAQKRLSIEKQVSAATPSQRGAVRARLTEEDKAAQSTNPEESTNAAALGNIAGQQAATQQSAAATDAANAEVRRAQAEDRLATAAGKSTDAIRQATIANQVAEFAFTHGGVAVDKYRNALEQATAAEQKREIAATVLQLNQQADASDRLAAAEQKGSAAGHEAVLENQAFADALKIAAQGTVAFTTAYNQYLDALKRADVSSGETGIQKELRARLDALAVAQLELTLTQRNVETRGAEVAALREKLKLQEQFPTATADELNNLVQIAGQEGKINAQIKANDEAEKDFRTVAKGVFTDITSAITDWANGTKTFKSALTDLSNQLLKLAQDQFIINPAKQMFDKQLGQGGTLGPGSFLGDLFGAGKGSSNAGVQDYTAPIGPTMGTGDPMPSELLPQAGGISNWFQSLFGSSASPSSATGGAANDNSLVKAGTDLTSAATKLGTDTAQKLAGAATDLGDLKNVLTTTSTMSVQASTVNLVGSNGATSAGGSDILSSLMGSGSTAGSSGVDGVTASTYSSGVSDAAVSLAAGYALGGAFSGGNAIPFASGSGFSGGDVFHSPTLFPMAGGRLGQLGEAGPEAIMPLTRGPGGKLGVQMHGGGGGQQQAPTVNSGHTINQSLTLQGNPSPDALNRARRTASQMSRDGLEQAQRKALRFGS